MKNCIMANIKFQVVKFERKLLFQVLDQIELEEDTGQFIEDKNGNTWGVLTSSCPELFNKSRMHVTSSGQEYTIPNGVFVRGTSESKYDSIVQISFTTDEERDVYYESLLFVLNKAFSQINKFAEFETSNWDNY